MPAKSPLGLLGSLVLSGILGLGCGGGDQPASGEAPGQDEAGAETSDWTPLPSPGSGTAITGTVHLEGGIPARETLDMSADPYCKTQHAAPPEDEAILTNLDGTLRNVFVYVKEGLPAGVRYAPRDEPVVLDQVGCQYRPHVFGIMVGQELTIVNSDGTLHNVHSLAKSNRAFNIGLPDQGMKVSKSFTSQEVMVRIKCDVHPWMECWAGVLPHPFFAVTGTDGAFTLADLPPGSYVIEAWHEELGVEVQSVSVTAGTPVHLDFTFRPKG